jgi:hypothetical protein
MKRYWDSAKVVAGLLNQSELLCTQPEVPQTNMFHLHFRTDREKVEKAAIEIVQKFGIGLIANLRTKDDGWFVSEISLGDSVSRIPEEKLEEAILSFNQILRESV